MRRLGVAALLLVLLAGVAFANSSQVVITAKGKKYHRSDCRTVKKIYRTLTKEDARKLGYAPCKVCKP